MDRWEAEKKFREDNGLCLNHASTTSARWQVLGARTVWASYAHLLFWFVYVQQHNVQKGLVKANIDQRCNNYSILILDGSVCHDMDTHHHKSAAKDRWSSFFHQLVTIITVVYNGTALWRGTSLRLWIYQHITCCLQVLQGFKELKKKLFRQYKAAVGSRYCKNHPHSFIDQCRQVY